MIRFSAALVAVAIGVLVGGIATSKLLIVYIAIVVSAVAMLALAIGVVLKREELFGGPGLVPAGPGVGPARPALGGDSRRPGWPDGGDSRQPGQAGSPFATGTPGLGTAFGGIAAVASGNTAVPWESLEAGDQWSLAPRPAQPVSPPQAPQSQAAPADATADAGTDAAPRSWFDRLGEPQGANAPTAPPSAWASPAAESATAPSASLASADRADGAAKPGDGAGKPEDGAAKPGKSGAAKSGKADGESPAGKAPKAAEPASSDDVVPSDATAGDPLPGDPLPGHAATPAAVDTTPAAVPDGQKDSDDDDASADEDVTWPESAAPTVSVAVLGSSAQPPARPVPAVPGSRGRAPMTVVTPVIDTAEDDTAEDDTAEDDTAEDDTAGDGGSAPADTAGPPAETATGSPEASTVSVIRGVPRYHEPDCVLIRFMPEADIQQLAVPEATAAGCTPCAACQPAR